jgi:hypothetical protein
MAIIVATTAENSPVYMALQLVRTVVMEENTKTHEDNDPLGISFPSLCHIVVFFLHEL